MNKRPDSYSSGGRKVDIEGAPHCQGAAFQRKICRRLAKFAFALAAAALCVILLLPTLPAAAAQESTHEKHRIIFGGDRNYPPFEYLDEAGVPKGFHIDLMRALGEVMGLEVEFRLGPWEQVKQAFEEGRIDVIALFYSDDRDSIMDFTEAHRILYYEIFIRQGGPEVDSLDQLSGLEVIAQAGSFIHDLLKKRYSDAHLVSVETESDALRLLASGKHDCAIVTRMGGRMAIQRFKLSNLEASSPPLLPREYRLAVAEGDTALLECLNEGLAILKETGRFSELNDRWFAGLLPREEPLTIIIWRIAWWILAPLGLIAALALVWSWSLKKQVARKTVDLRRELTERKRAEEALMISKAYAESIIDNFLDTLIVVDTEAKIKTVNPVTCHLLGYTEEEIIGQPVSMIFAEEEEEEEVYRVFKFFRDPERLKYIGKNDTIRNKELNYKTKDGRLIPMSFNASVMTDEAGSVTGVVAGAKDLTKIKLMEEARRKREEHYRKVIENIFKFVPEGLLVLTENLSLFRENIAFRDIVAKHSTLLNYTEQELAEIIIEQVKDRIINENKAEIRISKKPV